MSAHIARVRPTKSDAIKRPRRRERRRLVSRRSAGGGTTIARGTARVLALHTLRAAARACCMHA